MKVWVYDMIKIITRLHNAILRWNDGYEGTFTDKQLHFWIIGIIGMAMLFVIYPLFKLLSKKHILVVAWIYVFTLMVVITFAIEIGQGLTHTGTMDFDDIVAGLGGFMILFLIFAVIRLIMLLVARVIKEITKTGKKKKK